MNLAKARLIFRIQFLALISVIFISFQNCAKTQPDADYSTGESQSSEIAPNTTIDASNDVLETVLPLTDSIQRANCTIKQISPLQIYAGTNLQFEISYRDLNLMEYKCNNESAWHELWIASSYDIPDLAMGVYNCEVRARSSNDGTLISCQGRVSLQIRSAPTTSK